MKVYKLKTSFIKIATQLDSEFKENFNRPYLVVMMELGEKKYAIAMTTKQRSKHSFKVKQNQYILFDKCFEVIDDSIFECKYQFVSKMSDVPMIIAKKSSSIMRAFNTYLVKHPTEFSINNEKMIMIQEKYKF